MKHDILIAGVGGQGILTIAAIVGRAAMNEGLNVKQSEVHGMAQRGGAVVAHLRLSSATVHSDLIPLGGADVLLAVEPLEALRHLPYLRRDGVVLANTVPIPNIPDYPSVADVLGELRRLPRTVLVDADKMARDAGSPRAMNMVMLGALAPFLELRSEALTETIRAAFAAKGERIVDINLKAFAVGRDCAAGAAS